MRDVQSYPGALALLGDVFATHTIVIREAEEQRSSESDDLSLQVSLVAGGSQTQKWPHFAQQSRQRHSGDGRRNPVSGHRQESKEYKWQGAPARCIRLRVRIS